MLIEEEMMHRIRNALSSHETVAQKSHFDFAQEIRSYLDFKLLQSEVGIGHNKCFDYCITKEF
jgi:hypothetical protein